MQTLEIEKPCRLLPTLVGALHGPSTSRAISQRRNWERQNIDVSKPRPKQQQSHLERAVLYPTT